MINSATKFQLPTCLKLARNQQSKNYDESYNGTFLFFLEHFLSPLFLNGFETIKSGYLIVNDNLVAEL